MNTLYILGAFILMEFMAWFTHKYVMHGFLWVLHKDHHIPHHKRFERNDWFAVIFALPAAWFTYRGALFGFDARFFIGLGITLYGVSYFLFHDVLVHKRLKLFSDKHSAYIKAILQAHNDHHTGKNNFGFLFMVPLKYFKNEFSKP